MDGENRRTITIIYNCEAKAYIINVCCRKWISDMELSFGITFTFKFLITTVPPMSSLFIWYQLSWFRWHNVYLFPLLFHAGRDSEIMRLKQLLDEKAQKNNSTVTGSA
jgi:hypothetical protein